MLAAEHSIDEKGLASLGLAQAGFRHMAAADGAGCVGVPGMRTGRAPAMHMVGAERGTSDWGGGC